MSMVNQNGGMLAGVCSQFASRLGWNVWAIRAVLLILLIAEPIWTALGYALVALVLSTMDRHGHPFTKSTEQPDSLQPPELAGRQQHISELEQRFRKWEQSLKEE